MRYRHDIDGLRALAIVLVVVYHVWVGRVSGGVDVFLMISAFFLTGSFARRMQHGHPLAIGSFYVGRFRRLMPAAAVTIAGTLAAAWIIAPAPDWAQIWREGWASVAYIENWALAFNGVDYYAREQALPSVFQHFWSLSVQGQVFVLWPLIFVLGVLLVRWTRRSIRTVLVTLFGIVFAASMIFSIIETAELQDFAYFDTRARLWEFAAGSLLALVLPLVRIPARLSAVFGWTGIAAILACGMVIDVQGGFPGYLALWPVAATALVILSGAADNSAHAPWGPTAFLSSRPVRALGKDAYALYLVHWPVMILALTIQQRTEVGVLTGIGILAISLVLARVITLLVEQPLRLPSGTPGRLGRNLGVIGGCFALVAAVLVPWQVSARVTAEAQAVQFAGMYQGAGAVARGNPAPTPSADVPLRPAPAELDGQWLAAGPRCRGSLMPAAEGLRSGCTQTPGAEHAERLMVVVGDSHAEQFMGALLPVAENEGWGVVAVLLGGCSLEEPGRDKSAEGTCGPWREHAIEYAMELSPDALFTVITAASPDSADERLIAGAQSLVSRFNDAGIPIYGIRDNPRSAINLYDCAYEKRDCDRPLAEALQPVNPAAGLIGDVILIDFTPWICPDGLCRTEIGNVAVYLDNNHLTATYARSLAPALREQIPELLR